MKRVNRENVFPLSRSWKPLIHFEKEWKKTFLSKDKPVTFH
jgi:hypothetical protein